MAAAPAERPPTEAVLSLGSNAGDRESWLAQAADALRRLPGTRGASLSPVYESEPVGVPPRFRAQAFLNAVLILETSLEPDAFSRAVHAIETRLGRLRGTEPGLPRTIDIDIVAFGGLRLDTPDLVLPHPRAHLRRFVLQPLADLRPAYVLPGFSPTVSELLRALPERPAVRPWP